MKQINKIKIIGHNSGLLNMSLGSKMHQASTTQCYKRQKEGDTMENCQMHASQTRHKAYQLTKTENLSYALGTSFFASFFFLLNFDPVSCVLNHNNHILKNIKEFELLPPITIGSLQRKRGRKKREREEQHLLLPLGFKIDRLLFFFLSFSSSSAQLLSSHLDLGFSQ